MTHLRRRRVEEQTILFATGHTSLAARTPHSFPGLQQPLPQLSAFEASLP